MAERLVVLSPAAGHAALAELQARYPVLGTLPPRLAVADLDDGQADALRRLPSTEAIISDPAEPLPPSLIESERLFGQAWQRRRQGGVRERPGEGLPWDAGGFLPPDPPKPL